MFTRFVKPLAWHRLARTARVQRLGRTLVFAGLLAALALGLASATARAQGPTPRPDRSAEDQESTPLAAALPAAGPYRVRDIFPGSTSSIDTTVTPVELNGLVYFVADDGVHGKELWSYIP